MVVLEHVLWFQKISIPAPSLPMEGHLKFCGQEGVIREGIRKRNL